MQRRRQAEVAEAEARLEEEKSVMEQLLLEDRAELRRKLGEATEKAGHLQAQASMLRVTRNQFHLPLRRSLPPLTVFHLVAAFRLLGGGGAGRGTAARQPGRARRSQGGGLCGKPQGGISGDAAGPTQGE